jgi:hypothetical protein
MHFSPEILIALALQLIGYGMIRQQVKNLADAMAEEKIERKQIAERVRELEIATGPQTLSMAKKAGG